MWSGYAGGSEVGGGSLGEWDMSMKCRLFGIVFGLWVAFELLMASGTVAAQSMPPYPVLYGGRALLNGQPLPAGTRLEARIRDYQTWTIVEEGGVYRNLLVAPLSSDYYYGTVTFYALGLKAVEEDVFKPAGAPVFKATEYDLHFTGLAAVPSPGAAATGTVSPVLDRGAGAPGMWVAGLAVGVGLVVAIVMAVWLLVRRRSAG